MRPRKPPGPVSCSVPAANSQYMGGMIWGIGSALHEAMEMDVRAARYINDNIAEYLIPVNAGVSRLTSLVAYCASSAPPRARAGSGARTWIAAPRPARPRLPWHGPPSGEPGPNAHSPAPRQPRHALPCSGRGEGVPQPSSRRRERAAPSPGRAGSAHALGNVARPVQDCRRG
ncbi:MAG: molybdopterin-dependent oxidoreductase [Acetobacteraceae bacterium]|nr:molybdopterin-dependent oxidoreductase [Acetobacteraceae bacterium]